jgi:hypothetical protein
LLGALLVVLLAVQPQVPSASALIKVDATAGVRHLLINLFLPLAMVNGRSS